MGVQLYADQNVLIQKLLNQVTFVPVIALAHYVAHQLFVDTLNHFLCKQSVQRFHTYVAQLCCYK